MKRWTIEDLEKTTDLKFAACILNERREGLNPYTPLSQKLDITNEVSGWKRRGCHSP